MKLLKELTEMASVEQRQHLANFNWSGFKEIEEWLKTKGFKSRGYGTRSEVFSKAGSDKVVKVSFDEDECWLKFAKLAQKITSPHLPKVFELKRYKNKRGKRMFVAIIEKLDSVPLEAVDWNAGDNKNFLAWILFHGIIEYNLLNHQKLLGPLGVNTPSVEGIEDNKQFMDKAFDKIQQQLKPLADNFERSTAPLAQVLNKLKRSKGGDCFIDLQKGNVMYRKKTGDIVFVDPFAE